MISLMFVCSKKRRIHFPLTKPKLFCCMIVNWVNCSHIARNACPKIYLEMLFWCFHLIFNFNFLHFLFFCMLFPYVGQTLRYFLKYQTVITNKFINVLVLLSLNYKWKTVGMFFLVVNNTPKIKCFPEKKSSILRENTGDSMVVWNSYFEKKIIRFLCSFRFDFFVMF